MELPSGSCCNVRDHGAVGDGVSLDTDAINRAIVTCHRGGGGTVVVPSGIFLTGTIELLSNVTLHLDAGAVIKGSPNVADYRVLPFSSEGRSTALLIGIDAQNIAVTGRGTIDGNGDAFSEDGKADLSRDFVARHTRQGEDYCRVNDLPDEGPVVHKLRPGMLVLLLRCRGILVTGVTVRNAPNWCLHLACSEDAVLNGLEIKSSLLLPNSDGIDVSLCRNVRISDCNIEAGDDGIAFSPCADGFGSGSDENIAVQNCIISSRSAAIRIGPGDHPFRNLVFQNIIIRNSNRGIGLFIRKSESIENVVFSNILIETRLYKGKWWGKAEVIHLSAVADRGWSWGRAAADEAPTTAMGRIRNISFHHVIAEGDTGVVLWAADESGIENVVFDDMRVTLTSGALQETFGGNFDFRPAEEEARKVFAHDVPALFARGVKGLVVRQCAVEWRGALPNFFRHAFEIEHFEDLTLDGVRARQPQPAEENADAAIVLRDGRSATVRNGIGKPGLGAWLVSENVLGLHAEPPQRL